MIAATALGCAFVASLFAVDAKAQSAVNYARDESWLCRPGRTDACAVDEDATIVAADGSLTLESFHADPNAPIDCFYVYPTVSTEPMGNSDLAIGAEHKRAVQQQFARFGAKCRLYAPMYRQFTLAALRAAAGPRPIPFDHELGYRDVAAAWREYLAHDNHGRGFVLIGHSQGSGVLAELIRDEIDDKPVQDRLVSAILMGTSLPQPVSADASGAFKHIPVCRADGQTGCVIAFSDFRADSPPPAGSLFVRAPQGMQAVCANPGSLRGGEGPLDSYLSTYAVTVISDQTPRRAWTHPPRPIRTPFVKLPGLLSAQCQANDHGSYLAVNIRRSTGGARVADISGDVIIDGKARPEWGLHLIDANLAMGNLIAIVDAATKAYLAKGPK
jgi:hypothetical protein